MAKTWRTGRRDDQALGFDTFMIPIGSPMKSKLNLKEEKGSKGQYSANKIALYLEVWVRKAGRFEATEELFVLNGNELFDLSAIAKSSLSVVGVKEVLNGLVGVGEVSLEIEEASAELLVLLAPHPSLQGQ